MKVSIIIPLNEDRGYLDEAIESVNQQTYPDVELIVSHNIEYNCAQNINMGIQRSTGEAIKILAEDDILTPNCIEDLVKGLKGNDWVCANAEYFQGGFGIDIGYAPTLTEMLECNQIHGGTVLYHRRCFYERMYDELLHTAEEYEFHLHLLSRGYRLGYIDALVHRYRVHDYQKSVFTSAEMKAERKAFIETIKKRYHG